MKRAQIEALMAAHRQRAHLVASLHVLCQPQLEPDDHAFLREHADALAGADVLRWLSRCKGVSKAPVIRALSRLATSDRHQFRHEILGAGERFLDEHDWAELYEALRGVVPHDIGRALLGRTSGCDVYRALLSPSPWAPLSPPDPAVFGVEPAEAQALASRIAQAFDEALGQPSSALLRALYPVRYDERACRKALQGPAPDEVGAARMLWEIDRAGLMDRVGWPFALLPATTRFLCERAAPDGEALREAYVRHRALELPGEAASLGRAWLAAQLWSASERGVPWTSLLREVPASMRGELPELSPELCERIGREASSLPLLQALSARQLVPWAIDDGRLEAIALAEARASSDDWGPAIESFPAGLAEAVREKARRSTSADERASLLEWLSQKGQTRKTLVEMAIDFLREGEPRRSLVAWVARQLVTRTAWEQHGPALLSTLIARGLHGEIGDLITLSWSEARQDVGAQEPRAGGEGEVPRGFREAIHGAFAVALLDRARRWLDEGQASKACASLSALACLDPPSRLSRALHELGRRPQLPDDVKQLLAVNAGMLKHGDARDASLQGAIAAVHALADAQG